MGGGKSLNKKQDDTTVEFTVAMTLHVPQRANVPLQGLDRCALTV